MKTTCYEEPHPNTVGDSTVAWEIATRLLATDKEVACRVLGGSMSPFLSHGDIIWLQTVAASELRFGDVVLFQHNGRRIVHRFLRRKKVGGREVLSIKGDAMRHRDPPVREDQVLAKVVRVDKGNLKIAMESRLGRLLNVMMAILSCCPGLLGMAHATWHLGQRSLKATVIQ